MQDMNAGIVILQDGETPCIVCDQPLPHPVRHVEFNYEDHRLTMVYKTKVKRGSSKFNAAKQGHTFDFPLDSKFLSLLKERGNVGIAFLKGQEVIDFKLYSVLFLP